jgi:hypothetical protein
MIDSCFPGEFQLMDIHRLLNADEVGIAFFFATAQARHEGHAAESEAQNTAMFIL